MEVSLYTQRKLLNSPPIALNSTSNSNTSTTTNDDPNNPTVQTCLNYCNNSKKHTSSSHTNASFCPQVCLALCPSICHYSTNYPSPPYNSLTNPNKPHLNHNHSPLLISMLVLLAITFLLITFYIIYTKLYFHFYAPYSNSFLQTRPRSYNSTRARDNNFLGEENDHHHRVVFHPFWYISTVGLSTTAIQRIAVIKYGKEVVDEKDCAVCLGEFQEGESLRVLPKCSHAFHLPCIDTWLSMHKTCPLCRGPISLDDHHVYDDHNLMVENASSSSMVGVESTIENNSSLDDEELSVNDSARSTTREGENNINNLENYCMENVRSVNNNNNKGSFSQRWSLERGAASLLNRSLSCSGKFFSSSCSRSCPNS